MQRRWDAQDTTPTSLKERQCTCPAAHKDMATEEDGEEEVEAQGSTMWVAKPIKQTQEP